MAMYIICVDDTKLLLAPSAVEILNYLRSLNFNRLSGQVVCKFSKKKNRLIEIGKEVNILWWSN